MSEGARNTISVIDRNVRLATPYAIVFALFGSILYATFVVVSTEITMKRNLLDLGTEFLRTNMSIFTGGEIESVDLLSSRMMTENCILWFIKLLINLVLLIPLKKKPMNNLLYTYTFNLLTQKFLCCLIVIEREIERGKIQMKPPQFCWHNIWMIP